MVESTIQGALCGEDDIEGQQWPRVFAATHCFFTLDAHHRENLIAHDVEMLPTERISEHTSGRTVSEVHELAECATSICKGSLARHSCK